MGTIYKCPRHNYQGVIDMCRHLFDAITNHEPIEIFKMPTLDTRICRACFYGFGADKLDDFDLGDILITSDEELERLYIAWRAVYDQLDRAVMCYGCMQEHLAATKL